MNNIEGDIFIGDVTACLAKILDESVQCVATSPPYWGLRDYGVAGQIGLEATPTEYITQMVAVFREVWRVLRKDGTLWLNMGDCYATGAGSGKRMGGECFGKQNQIINAAAYPQCQPNRMPIAGLKPKDLCGIPWMLAFALRADGWYLRSDIIWHKPNPMPESVTDRPTKSHEYIFLLSKNKRYFYDAEAIQEPWTSGRNDMRHHGFRTGEAYIQESMVMDNSRLGDRKAERDQHNYLNGRNKRSVWTVATQPFPEAHFATFPEDLITPCILAGSREGDMVLDPFCGSGTTGVVALRYHRNFIGIELNPEYAEMSRCRIVNDAPMFNQITRTEFPLWPREELVRLRRTEDL